MFKIIVAAMLAAVVVLGYKIVSHPNRRARVAAVVTDWCSGDRQSEVAD